MLVYKGEQITPAEAIQLLNSDDEKGGLPCVTSKTNKPLYGTHWDYCATRLAMANEEPNDTDLKESLDRAIAERGQDLFDLAVAVVYDRVRFCRK